jgi:hypothetical protein
MMLAELPQLIPGSPIINFIPIIPKIPGAAQSNPRY